MMRWRDTPEADAFVASADSRETSPEILRAIAWFADSLDEANACWEDPDRSGVATVLDIWERVTGNGRRPAEDYCWGAAGSRWAPKAGE